jgi:hypothetical protein
VPLGQVLTWAVITRPRQARVIVVAGRLPAASRAGEVAVNETAARLLHARVGSVIRLRGYRPAQLQPVLNGARLLPRVRLPGVRVAGIVRSPADLTENPDAPADVSFLGTGSVYADAAFYHRYGGAVGSTAGLSFHLRRGTAGLPAFEGEVKRLAGQRAQVLTGSDDQVAAVAAQRGTLLQAFALLLFGCSLALSMLVIMGQSIARQAYAAAAEFPVLRALGASRGQLTTVAAVPGLLVAAGGMVLAVPAGYALSVFTPIGLARRAEVAPGFSFDAPVVLGGAAALGLLLAGRAAVAAFRAAGAPASRQAAEPVRRGSRVAGRLAAAGFPPAAVAGIRLAFEPGGGRAAVPVRPAIAGTVVALAAVMAALVFGSSLANVVRDPAVAGWDWDVTVGNPHSGDFSAQAVPRLRADAGVAGFTATAMGGARLGGRDVLIVGLRRMRGDVAPPVLAGRLPRGPREIALGGRELRALGKRVGDLVTAGGAVPLRIVGQVVLSPEIANEQVQLGSGGAMTLAGADALSGARLPVNVFLVRLQRPGDQAAIGQLRRQFAGTVLPALPPPEVRDLQGVQGLPLALALLVSLLAVGTVAHTLVTSVRRRSRELAILKAVGFVGHQVRAAVAWQATALAGSGLIIGLPLGLAAGRWAWTLFAGQVAIEPVPVISVLVLLAIPAVLAAANAIAAFPAQVAARTQPAVVLRAE